MKSKNQATNTRKMLKIIATANGARTARRAPERKRAAPKAMRVDDKENDSIEKKTFPRHHDEKTR